MREDEIIFIEYQNLQGEIYFSLPGGGQEIGIDLRETLKREFIEETGINIQVNDILLVREFIDNNPTEELWRNGIHQIEVIFDCNEAVDNNIINDRENNTNKSSLSPDKYSIGTRWIKQNELQHHKIYPSKELDDLINKRSIKHQLEINGKQIQ